MQTERLFERIDSIHLEGITKKYGHGFAVKDLDLEIQGGELLILIGPSGSGKTTALRMINRMIEQDAGTVTINGINTKDADPVRLRRNMGYVIQNIGLFPHMTIGENIGLVPKLEGWDKERIKERVRTLLEFVSLPPDMFMDRYPRQLSGGQQQRVGLARAMAMDPPLFLMDEPFGALDPILRKQLQKEFLKIKNEINRTIVFVTHDIEEALVLGDRIAIMNQGELVQVGPPEELIFNPANELVADIVDTQRKFKHMDTLKVKDLMSPFDEKYVLEGRTETCDAVDVMTERDLETAFVFEGERLIGQVTMVELMKCRTRSQKLSDVARPVKIFQPTDSVAFALSEMKSTGEYLAIVMNSNDPIGILISDEVLLKLI
ncbi:ABC transporter ATP-binding protein [Methanolobus profundi]|uniref:Molybdate/tungstate import ATP-binding protein WtpC n=1 Tax=Methanolobus profundi TaxID=487685 RepID=A0A1I4T1D8_9EURY|nr:betaine/proline/choline family ABC transporter ATP-binding protein [Methanolobus profundi]SFM70578.1 osmoprotectant transport system ATP-binding protein [Methanolobus profundi]